MLVSPVNARVMAFRSVGSTPLLRVSTAIISEDGAPGVVNARELDPVVVDGLHVDYNVKSHERRWEQRYVNAGVSHAWH